MLVPVLVLLASDTAASVVDKCNAFLKSATTLSVHVEASADRIPGKGVGTLTFSRPSKLHFEMNWSGQRYAYTAAGKEGLEMERGAETYAEFDLPGSGFTAPPGVVSYLPKFGFPAVLVVKDVGRLLFGPQRVKLVGEESVAGSKALHLQSSVKGEEGSAQVDLWVRPNGEPAKFKVDVQSVSQSIHYAQTYSGYVLNKSVSPATYATLAPRGFTPYAFTDEPVPIQPDAPMPLRGWADLKTGAAANLDKQIPQRRLFALMAPGCEPSMRALPTLKVLDKTIPVVILSAESSRNVRWPETGLRICYDPAGDAVSKLNSPGTPFFILTNGKGNVMRVWYGFDPAQSEALAREIAEAAGR
jgi:hypothetical protein